jgi:hypothetical protein
MALNDEIKKLLAAFADFTKNEVRKSARDKGITFGGQDSRMLNDSNFITKYSTTSNSLKLTIEIVPEYAVVVDKGRQPNQTPPPIEPIKAWIKRKGILKSERVTKTTKGNSKKAKPSFEKRLTAMAYGISKNIGKNGTMKRFGYRGSNFWSDVINGSDMDSEYNKLKTDLLNVLKKEVNIEIINSIK